MMRNWKKYRLGEIATKIGSGATPRGGKEQYLESGTFSLVRSQNVLDFSFTKNGLAYISEEQANGLRNVELEENDILLNITGDSVARVCQIPNDILPARVNQHVAIIRGKKDIIDQYFLKYFLLQPTFKRYMIGLASAGATRNALTKSMIESFEVFAPDLATQSQIAQILTSFDDKIELLGQMNQTLETMAQTIFKEWFVDFNFPKMSESEFTELKNEQDKSSENEKSCQSSNSENPDSDKLPKGWRMGKLGEIVEFTNGYAFKSNELLSTYSEDCYHIFKMGHIKKGGGLNIDGTKSYYKKTDAVKLSKYVLQKGDLLMCMTDMKGNVALLGHTALMNESNKYIVNQRVGLLRVANTSNIDYPYLFILTNYPEFIAEIRSRANSGVQVNLSTSEIKNTDIIIPPPEINKKYDSIAKPIFEKIFSNIEQIRTLTQLRDNLLPKLMSGAVVVVSGDSLDLADSGALSELSALSSESKTGVGALSPEQQQNETKKLK